MQEIILIKIGELFLKGANKKDFERKLIKNIKLKINEFGDFKVELSQSVITVTPVNLKTVLEDVLEAIGDVFGINSFSRAALCNKDIKSIKSCSKVYLKDQILKTRTFKVETNRADKSFPLSSYEISATLGEYLLNEFDHLKVDVHKPELTIYVEIRKSGAYIRGNPIKGVGGLPARSCGKVLSLISGGIDSPVSSFLMAKRGADVLALHFTSPPYTSKRAEDKVISLIKRLNRYLMSTRLIFINIAQIQEKIKKHCKEEYFTLIMRRFMMKIAEKIALENNCGAIVTGESLGQVASQTLNALICTNVACKHLPVLRPLIGMDKNDIIKIAEEIGTFSTSILPYEDCCTVFTPKHPKTKPSLEYVLEEENKLDCESLINTAIEGMCSMIIGSER